MKKIFLLITIILTTISISSCTAERLEDATEIATDGDKEHKIPDPDDD